MIGLDMVVDGSVQLENGIIVYGQIKGSIKTTIINGKIVYDNKKFYKYKNNNFFVSPMLGNKI